MCPNAHRFLNTETLEKLLMMWSDLTAVQLLAKTKGED